MTTQIENFISHKTELMIVDVRNYYQYIDLFASDKNIIPFQLVIDHKTEYTVNSIHKNLDVAILTDDENSITSPYRLSTYGNQILQIMDLDVVPPISNIKVISIYDGLPIYSTKKNHNKIISSIINISHIKDDTINMDLIRKAMIDYYHPIDNRNILKKCISYNENLANIYFHCRNGGYNEYTITCESNNLIKLNPNYIDIFDQVINIIHLNANNIIDTCNINYYNGTCYGFVHI